MRDFTAAEQKIIRRNMAAAIAEAVRMVRDRGVTVHPRILAHRAKTKASATAAEHVD